MKSELFSKVVAHSVSEETGIEIATFHMHLPRCLLAELNTHRVFSRNSRSSRAVPIPKMIEEVKTKPYIPWHWGKNQKGMQATEECNERVVFLHTTQYPDKDDNLLTSFSREEAWLVARDNAVAAAEGFMEAGYHKQIVNRLLEPFMWVDSLVTSTDWANFNALRDHKDAEPHFHDLAALTIEAYTKSKPQSLSWNEYHLPYITEEDKLIVMVRHNDDMEDAIETLKMLSAARCARISYAPFDGSNSIEAELERASKLLTFPVHASPFEHQARPDYIDGNDKWGNKEYWGNFFGWIQNRREIPNHDIKDTFKEQFEYID